MGVCVAYELVVILHELWAGCQALRAADTPPRHRSGLCRAAVSEEVHWP